MPPGSSVSFTSDDGSTAVAPMDGLPEPTEPLRWGILGCSSAASDLALALQVCPLATLAAVAEHDDAPAATGRAEAFAKALGVARAHSTMKDLMQDPEVDIVYIATSAELHKAHATAALSASKHVLLEKPLATTVEDGEAIVAAARASGKFCMEGVWTYFFPAFELVRSMVSDNKFGTILSFNSSHCVDRQKHSGSGSEKWSIGATLELAPCPLHACLGCLGLPNSARALGCRDPDGCGVDAHGVAYLRYGPLLSGVVSWSYLMEQPGETNISSRERGWIRLESPSNAPTAVTITESNDGQPPSRQGTNWRTRRLCFALPEGAEAPSQLNGMGLVYAIAAVQRCVAAGKTECPQASLQTSLEVLRLLVRSAAEIRAKPEAVAGAPPAATTATAGAAAA